MRLLRKALRLKQPISTDPCAGIEQDLAPSTQARVRRVRSERPQHVTTFSPSHGPMNSTTAQALIEQLGLARHPEGGWFRETYRASEEVPAQALPARFGGGRAFSTAIYFLLEAGDISALHRIRSDEVWHFYAGSALNVHCILPDGAHQVLRLGANPAAGERFQAVAPAGCWFGAELVDGGFALVGCTVAPGFDFADFEMGEARQLADRYPQHAALIARLTRA